MKVGSFDRSREGLRSLGPECPGACKVMLERQEQVGHLEPLLPEFAPSSGQCRALEGFHQGVTQFDLVPSFIYSTTVSVHNVPVFSES